MTPGRDHLRADDLSLAQIAEAVGCGSPFAFAAAFRRHHGVPPGRWRVENSERAQSGGFHYSGSTATGTITVSGNS